jgi:hypothetical protein
VVQEHKVPLVVLELLVEIMATQVELAQMAMAEAAVAADNLKVT